MEVKFNSGFKGVTIRSRNSVHPSRGENINKDLCVLCVVRKLEIQTYLTFLYQIKSGVKSIIGPCHIDDVGNKFEEETIEARGLVKNSQGII